jgi:hypothetical protein
MAMEIKYRHVRSVWFEATCEICSAVESSVEVVYENQGADTSPQKVAFKNQLKAAGWLVKPLICKACLDEIKGV